MKNKKVGHLVIMAVVLSEAATEQVSVQISYDENGVPQSATAQKELVDDQKNVTPDGGVVNPVISPTAKAKYADAINAAKAELEAQIVADNFPNGDFSAWVDPAGDNGGGEIPAEQTAQ